jgi:zinc protease
MRRAQTVARGAILLSALTFLGGVTPLEGQRTRPVGRDAAMGLRFREVRFDPPRVQERELKSGIPVFLMEDHSLPLVTLYARFRGGYALLPRSSYAAASALSGLLRSGGTSVLPPDSVDHLVDFYALQMTFGGGGESTFSSINTLTKHLEPAIELWADILRNPRFDSVEVEVWRDRQLESVRRRDDDPGLLAVSEFNRIMFGDHPIGWEMTEEDLASEKLNSEAVFSVHERVFCPENLILGVVGDARWSELQPLLEGLVADWPSCGQPLREPQVPNLRKGPKVYLIPKDLTQSTIVMAGPGGVSQGSNRDYFASRIGNTILGTGGFSSRLMSKVRTDLGYTYSASSFWTTPSRYEGIVGATTSTKSESTVEVVRLMKEIIQEMGEAPPHPDEVDQVISQIVNSFVFNFQDPSQIVSRQMFYQSQELPDDWLEQYVRGIQRVDPEDVQRVFRRHVKPDEMVVLIVGDPEDFDMPPETLGQVEIWDVRGTGEVSEPRREGPLSRR